MKVSHFGDLDIDRWSRTGTPEVILAEGKQDAHLSDLARAFVTEAGLAVVSRLTRERAHLVEGDAWQTTYHEEAQIAILRTEGAVTASNGGTVCVLAAGTADVGVAEEVRLVAEVAGCTVSRVYDVGLAGPHRLEEALASLDEEPDVFVAVAGREAALPVALAARTDRPVIAVPTSVGYGAGGKGEAALLGCLQACAPLLVVNIDAGVPAGLCAAKIAALAGRARHGATQTTH